VVYSADRIENAASLYFLLLFVYFSIIILSLPRESVYFFYFEKIYIQKWHRQCPSGPLQHILINILFCHSDPPPPAIFNISLNSKSILLIFCACTFHFYVQNRKNSAEKKINYYILTQYYVFSVCFHYSLLGYRSQQWLHLYSVSTTRFLVTFLKYQSSPASTANIFFYYYSEKVNIYIYIYIYYNGIGNAQPAPCTVAHSYKHLILS
jgi:hypothetical protein